MKVWEPNIGILNVTTHLGDSRAKANYSGNSVEVTKTLSKPFHQMKNNIVF